MNPPLKINNKFFFYKDGLYFKTNVIDIEYISSNDNYCKFYISNEVTFTVRTTIKEIELRLKEFGFVRTHRKYIINPDQIKSVDFDQNTIVLLSGAQVLLSRSQKQEIKNLGTFYR